MLTNKDINQKYEDLLEKKEQLDKVAKVIQEACKDLNIQISSENVILMEELIEQTGQYKVLKKDYIASWESLVAQLKSAGYSETVVDIMTRALKFGNWEK